MGNLPRRRLGSNKTEGKLRDIAEKHGIELTRRGYPDYAILLNGEIVGFIEVKRRQSHRLKGPQQAFARLCARHGIPFVMWTPADLLPDWFWSCKSK